MSTSIVRSRHQNTASLGSRFDWFVIETGAASDDISVQLNPAIYARVKDPYAAANLVKYLNDRAEIKDLSLTYKALSYTETCDYLDEFDWRLRSFDDTFNLTRSKYTVRFSDSKEISVTAYSEPQAVMRAQYRLESLGVINPDVIESAEIIFVQDV